MLKIFVYQKDGEDLRQCNACGFVEERPKEVTPVPSEHSAEGTVKFIQMATHNPLDKDH